MKDLARQNGQSVEEAASNFVKQHRPTSLLQRFASVEEIANMVVYVSSKEASATNGRASRRRRHHPDRRVSARSRSAVAISSRFLELKASTNIVPETGFGSEAP